MQAIGVIVALIVWAAIKTASLAFIFWFEAYYPEVFERIHVTYTERARRSVLLGLFNLAAWFLIAVLLINTQVFPFAVLGFVILACLIGAAVLGYAPAYRELGERLASDTESSRTRKLALGWLCLELAFLTPLIGQLLSFGVLVRGLGAVVAAALAARRNEDTAFTPPDTTSPPPVSTPEADPSS